MAKLNSFLLLSWRSYGVAVENVREQPLASMIRKARDLKAEVSGAEKKENFWMRDPKTGNWIPVSHFGEIDVAELREKLLTKKHKF